MAGEISGYFYILYQRTAGKKITDHAEVAGFLPFNLGRNVALNVEKVVHLLVCLNSHASGPLSTRCCSYKVGYEIKFIP